MQKLYYSYEAFREDTNQLIKMQKEFKPESIVGIARGGLTLAHAMAEGLKIRKVETLRTELYDGSSKRDCISIFGSCDLKSVSRVLVVDDISDSGETLKNTMEYLESEYPEVAFQSATLFYKSTSVYKPHNWINEANQWIDFFWERDFTQES